MLARVAIAVTLIACSAAAAHAAAADSALKAQDAATALVRGDTGQAVVGYTEALKDPALPNDRRATILNDRAVAYARLGQTKLAIDDFNRAAQLFPEYAAIYNNRGNLLLALGYPEEAIKDFNRAIILAPGYAAALSNRAGAYSKVGHTDEAIRDYTVAVRLMPQSAAPLAGRGRVHLAAGRPHAAIRDFTRAVTADPRFAAGYRSRAEAKLDIGRPPDAIEDLSRAIAFDVDNPELYLLRGQAYLASDNSEAALKDFTHVTTLDPNSARGFAARGLASGMAQSYEEAFGDLNRAIELDPRSAVAFAYRAVVYKLSGQTDVGLKDAETAEKLDPDGPDVLWAKGEIEEAQGRTEQAVADYKRALALRPRLKLAADGLQRLGADPGSDEEREVVGVGIEPWRVMQHGSRYYAVSDQYRKLRIPLEMAGDDPNLLEQILITSQTGAQIPISQVADIRYVTGPPMIRSEDGKLVGFVFVDTDRAIADYVVDARRVIEEQVTLPSGVRLGWAGQFKYFERAKAKLKIVVPITLLFVVLLLYWNTQSVVETAIVMLAVPFSVIGAIWLLYLLDYNMSVAVWVGLIALAGLDAETGVVMLLYLTLAHKRRSEEGGIQTVADLREAIVEGAAQRVRPKLMTVMTTMIGLLPVLWSTGTGADVMKRIAAPMVGGLVTSFFLELTVYPAIFSIWKGRGLPASPSQPAPLPQGQSA